MYYSNIIYNIQNRYLIYPLISKIIIYLYIIRIYPNLFLLKSDSNWKKKKKKKKDISPWYSKYKIINYKI